MEKIGRKGFKLGIVQRQFYSIEKAIGVLERTNLEKEKTLLWYRRVHFCSVSSDL